MIAPVTYIPKFIEVDYFDVLRRELEFERRDDAPRNEVWMNDYGTEYTYGQGAGRRTYKAKSLHPLVRLIQEKILKYSGVELDGCFVNGYENARDWLGWHADDSPEIDSRRPIAVVSFGAARKIQFRLIADPLSVEEILLEPGSLLLMHPGMQDTWMHRIPKCGSMVRPRISLTYRGLIR